MQNSFDIVIATRNRPEALKLSIPYLLNNQDRLPEKFIIVDASDDHEAVRKTLDGIKNNLHQVVEITLIKSAFASSSYQRNLGLDLVTADVVIFPDDDSMFFPHAVDAMMQVYDLDTNQEIAGVCAAESIKPPPDFPVGSVYKEKISDTIRKMIGRFRYKAEHILCPDPFYLFGRKMISRYIPLIFFGQNNVVQVEYMTGFRMSFRSEIIKKHKFSEVFCGYCLFEDTDASFSTYKSGMLVGARNALIYHHKFPTKRSSGFIMGLLPVLNRAYIVAKHAPNDKRLLVHLKIYCLYKFIQYLVGGLKSQYAKDRARGASFGLKNMERLLSATTQQEVDHEYTTILNKIAAHQ
ncbi:MAG: glycosyltransferase family 2 protein [Deltaproteobacteria bacterium]|nr:glycosyltransferase family 2 protein [Deltaproteobacteria bacterium]